MIKLVVFDLDGTLIDSLEDLKVATNYALSKYNLPPYESSEIKNFIGHGMGWLMKCALGEKNRHLYNEAQAIFQDYYTHHALCYTKVYDGIFSVLKYLNDNNIKIAICSNKIQIGVEKISEHFFKDYHIDMCVGDGNNLKVKPAPDMINKILNTLKISNLETLYVGDGETDMETAKNANITACGVTYGYRNKEILKKYNPKYLIDNAIEIINIIEKENKNG